MISSRGSSDIGFDGLTFCPAKVKVLSSGFLLIEVQKYDIGLIPKTWPNDKNLIWQFQRDFFDEAYVSQSLLLGLVTEHCYGCRTFLDLDHRHNCHSSYWRVCVTHLVYKKCLR